MTRWWIAYREHPDADPSAWRTRSRSHEGVAVAEVEHNLDLSTLGRPL